MSDIVWTPRPEDWQASALARFARQAGFDPQDYDGLHRWSVSDLNGFWDQVWRFCDIIGDRDEVAFQPDPARWMTGARFFPDARINLAENFLVQTGPDAAVIETDETGHRAEYSADTLRAMVARVAEGLRAAGVRPGDRVGTVLPNRIEALVTLLATAAVGGVWTSCSPDFGAAAILDRIGQVRPKVLFAGARFTYGGKSHDISARLGDVVAGMDGLDHLVMVGAHEVDSPLPVTAFEAFGTDAPLRFDRVGFDDPVYVMYTSGTTGKPKAIVHRTGGVVLTQRKEHVLHADTRPGDRVMWYSNTAWMMYHWITAAMGSGASLVLYDGAPILKGPDGLDAGPLWKIVAQERLTHLGISPKYLSAVADSGYRPRDHVETGSLRWMLAAGSPMGPHQFDWLYDAVSDGGMGFASISGGTEIMGCLLIGAPTRPVRRGTLTVRALGMATNVLDDRGAPVIGRAGELVCTEPFPSMPLTFWGEDGLARYHATYFGDRAEIWTHGDHATLHADGSAVIHGRSDFTLNPGGVRIGTADIYNVCETFPEIADCIVFGRPTGDDEEIVLCLVMAEGHRADDALAHRIRSRLRGDCSPRHVPAAIHVVPDVPYTVSGKRIEGAAKAMATGGTVANKASMANPECLEAFAVLKTAQAL